MGEKWWPNSAWDMHPGFFYMPQICDMGPIILLPFRRKACWGIFYRPLKIRRLRPGLNPRANLGIRGQHSTSAPPKPLFLCYLFTKVQVITIYVSSARIKGLHVRFPFGLLLVFCLTVNSAHEGGEVVSLMHWPPLPQGMYLVLIFTKGWVDPSAIVRSEGICHWKIQWHHRESIPGPFD